MKIKCYKAEYCLNIEFYTENEGEFELIDIMADIFNKEKNTLVEIFMRNNDYVVKIKRFI